MTKEEKIELLQKAVRQGEYPRVLYKFRDLGERTVEIIEKSEIWFATAQSFNDPFDCDLSETIEHTLQDLTDYLNYLRHNGKHIGDKDFEKIVEEFKSNPEKIRKICIDARTGAINNKGILSLSEVHDNILMWSHYGKDHTGIALGFDVLEDPAFFLDPFKVSYVSSYEPLNYFRARSETVTKNITTKSQHWDYEREIRIIAPTPGLRPFSRNCLQTIHFGCRAKDEDVDKIKVLCASHGLSHVQFFRARKGFGYFGLEFESI